MPQPPPVRPRLPPPDADPARSLVSALALLALPSVVLALAVLLGAGVLHQGRPLLVSLGAGLLVLLPSLGVSVLFRRRMLGFALGLLLWPTTVVIGFPLYFPGERAEALTSGGAVLLLPLGLTVDADHARTLDEFLPGPVPVRTPPPRAEIMPAEPVPPPHNAALAQDDQVVLPYDGDGRTMSVQVSLEHKGGEVSERWLLFDTGATLTTLDRKSLAGLGVEVRTDAPEVTVRTAAGERRTRLALVDRMWIGGMEVRGVTVSVCDACADEETAGLLGMNVSGLFRVTVDTAREEIVLVPRDGPADRAVDVAPWLQLEATATRWQDGRVEVEVRSQNLSPRLVELARVGIHCEDSWVAELRNVPPLGTASTIVALPVGTECKDYRITLDKAYW